MRYGSVCSGIEAATTAWHSLGWTPAWFAEIDGFPRKVLAQRYPGVPNLGDMTKIHEFMESYGAIDLLVGGTPCQSFSVAGLRKGLADPRGNLTLIYLSLAQRARPRWLVWENVPGVLSDNEGRTFGTFLGGLAKLGYGFAYRVLDAQYVRVESHPRAVPQRRRRVFVVGCLGDWRSAAAVLFERESLCGHPPPSRKAGTHPTGTLSSRTSGGGGLGTDFECDGGLVAQCLLAKPNLSMDPSMETLVAHSLRGEGFDASEDGTGRGIPIVAMPFDTTQITSPISRANPDWGDPCHTLSRGAHPPAIAYQISGNDGARETGDIVGTLTSGTDKSANTLLSSMGVRRLTPLECERLQGFPDGYTAIEGAKDGPRYKALGNSMALNVMNWIGSRIEQVEGMTHDDF